MFANRDQMEDADVPAMRMFVEGTVEVAKWQALVKHQPSDR
jgi:hypothetical protein